MITGTLATVSNRADWIVGISAIDDTTGDPFDWTLTTDIVVSVNCVNTNSPILTGSLADGKITHTEPGSVQWHFPASEMSNISPGSYGVGFAYRLNGIVITEIIATLPVIEGYAQIP